MKNGRIREAEIADAQALLAIYEPYVLDTAITFEYDAPSTEEFADRIRHTKEQYPYLVLETENGEIAGYAYASCFKARAAYQWSAETSIYVKMGMHGKGYGRALYEKLEECLKAQNVLNVNACIAYAKPDNDHLDNSSYDFHKHLGYALVGTFHDSGYKFEQWYDMIWMEKMIGVHLNKNAEFLPFPKVREMLILVR